MNYQIIKEIKKQIKKYPKNIFIYNAPGKNFYLSSGFEWIGDGLLKKYGVSVPYFVGFSKNGLLAMETPLHIGPAEKLLQEVKRQKYAFLISQKQSTKKILRNVNQWIKRNKVLNGKSLQYYLNYLKKAREKLVEYDLEVQLSSQIEELLMRELTKVFNDSKIKKSGWQKFCVADETPAFKKSELKRAKLRQIIEKEGLNVKTKKLLKKSYANSFFLQVSYAGVTFWTLDDELKAVKKAGFLKGRKPIVPKLNKKQKFWVDVSKYFSWERDIRKEIQQKMLYRKAEALERIAQKIHIERTELEYLFIEQLNLELFKDKKKLVKLIKEQKQAHIFCWTKKTRGFRKAGDEAEEIFKQVSVQRKTNAVEFKGVPTCKGYAKGVVKIIFDTHSKNNFNKGDILITGMTSPDFVPLMKKAGAIITELGGVTCHVAIITRELNKPCITSVKNITVDLKDGDIVEVDASKGVIRKIIS